MLISDVHMYVTNDSDGIYYYVGRGGGGGEHKTRMDE
jgi:hypothetical protein